MKMKSIKTVLQKFNKNNIIDGQKFCFTIFHGFNVNFKQYIDKKKSCTNYIQSFIKDDKKILGRWNIEHCNKKINNKIDLSNEDHCGPCGQYLLTKTKDNIK